MQQADFEGIFEAMAGLPVTIRLLDPPLHEFLPSLEEAADDAVRARVRQRTGRAPLVEVMHPLVGFGEELRRLRELTVDVAAEEGELDYRVGTMIELPRACIRADEIAEHADFFSFGTNDLTQTALGF